ncbi:MAG: protoporphyrinogen oxidase [Planctomycetaceae bacterium]
MTLKQTQTPKSVAVIGGGITGLAAAQRLAAVGCDVRVTLFEASGRLGGLIHTVRKNGYLIERGPDSFITNKPGGVRLCEDIGFSSQLIPTDSAWRRSLVLRNGQPLPVPDGYMLMAPSNLQAIRETPVLSEAGRQRLLAEVDVPARTENTDESLADFVRRRFGSEVLERLVQPLVGGIYTSDPEKLSLEATLPRFPDMERRHGSVIAATMAEQKRKAAQAADSSAIDDDTIPISHPFAESAGSGARYGLFAAPQNGMSSLIDAIESWLKASGKCEFRMHQSVAQVTREEGTSGWTVTFPDGSHETFDAVVLTLPTARIAEVLPGTEFNEVTSLLRQIEYASSAIVVSGHSLSDFRHPLDAFGLVIPHIENRRILAVSFGSRKFAGRAPEGHILLRTFVGGAMQPEQLEHSDEQIQEIVNQELTSILGMHAAPEFSEVVRYPHAMPQYHVGHLARVDRIHACMQSFPSLQLAGSAFYGVGIPDSIASGRLAADRLFSLNPGNGSGKP